MALKIKTPFDKYIFIEKDGDRCGTLEEQREEFPALVARKSMNWSPYETRLRRQQEGAPIAIRIANDLMKGLR